MKRYQKWLATLGLFALTPGMLLPPSICEARSRRATKAEKEEDSTVKKERAANQRMAEVIAAALQRADLGNEDFDVQFQNGVATLIGPVTTEKNRQLAERVTKGVPGVKKVENGLTLVSAPKAPAQAKPVQAIRPEQTRPEQQRRTAQPTKPAQRQYSVEQTGLLAAAGNEPIQAPPSEGQEGLQPIPHIPAYAASQGQPPTGPAVPGQPFPQGYPSVVPPGYVPTSVPVPPGHGSGGGYPGGYPFAATYDQPNLPNYAWPTYANYPNYAQVAYPKQYSASAYPYIGPFHPYPQIPLGWRRVQLEWDDGYWQLNFRPRTEKWWWFMDPRNW